MFESLKAKAGPQPVIVSGSFR